MIAQGLHRSIAASSQISSLVKHIASAGSLQGGHSFAESPARYYSSEPSLQATEENGFKGHSMLAPFTAGWQSTDLHPLVIERSEGSYVYDINGKKYIDALAGLWCTALGGNEPRLVKAATEQLNKLPFYHSFWNRTTKPSLDLANDILSMFTAREMGKVFFTNSGSEANDSQVKLVWYYNNALGRPDKKKFIARSKSYHGSTLIAASLSGLPALHQKFDLPAPFVLHTDCPHYWRFRLPDETEEDFSTRLANNLENLILKEGPDTIAAFIAEPVMGAGGVILPPKTYFEKVQAVLKKYDILLIADEVITAFGRLGTMFGCDMYNIKPDLVSIAKALSSAYMPIGAILVSPEITDVIYSQSNKLGSFAHGFTYSGHPVSCAVAVETLKIYKERNIIDHVNKIAPRFQEGIKAFSGSPIVGEIRGLGLILGTEFVDNKSPNDPFPAEWAVGSIFGAECEKRGMLIRVAGDSIMLSPPLIMTPNEVEEDEKEVALCMKELNAPSFYPSLVSLWITDSFERKDLERELLAKLLVHLCTTQEHLLSQRQLLQGFQHVLSTLEDAVTDAPKATKFLGQIFARVILEDGISLTEVGGLLQERDGREEPAGDHALDDSLTSEVLGSMLESIRVERGDNAVDEIRAKSNLQRPGVCV